MKKVLLFAVLIAAGIASQAQAKFGVKAALNFAKFAGDDKDFGIGIDPKFRMGLALGGFANVGLSDKFSFQPELLYSMEGAKYEEDGEEAIIKTDFINIPLLFQYNASGFYAETGPQIGFLMSAKASDGDEDEDIKDSFKGTNFSWLIGLGYKLPSGLGFGARYNVGLSNIIDADDADLKTSGFHLSFFYTFGGGAAAAKK